MINDGGRLHHDNKNVIRNFLFLGFQPIAPGGLYILMIMVSVVMVIVVIVVIDVCSQGTSSFRITRTLFASCTPS